MKESTNILKISDYFKCERGDYLFAAVAKEIEKYKKANPNADIISLGVGDVSLPLAPIVCDAYAKAALELKKKSTFRGYPPYYGHDFLKSAIVGYYKDKSVDLSDDEIFVSDGAKRELNDLLTVFSDFDAVITSPSYPVYADACAARGARVEIVEASAENGFIPLPERVKTKGGAVVYLCSPSNPTGAAYPREVLKSWVEFALTSGSLIIFDAAYESFASGDIPRSIYAVEGAKTCAIEVCSLSKSAGFTGVRCGWTVIPKELVSCGVRLNDAWKRRQATATNGVSYPVQAAAAAALSDKGREYTREAVKYYLEIARILKSTLVSCGIECYGAENSPYVFMKCPNGFDGQSFFEFALKNAQVVVTPGGGFGESAKNYARLSGLNDREKTVVAAERLRRILDNQE